MKTFRANIKIETYWNVNTLCPVVGNLSEED